MWVKGRASRGELGRVNQSKPGWFEICGRHAGSRGPLRARATATRLHEHLDGLRSQVQRRVREQGHERRKAACKNECATAAPVRTVAQQEHGERRGLHGGLREGSVQDATAACKALCANLRMAGRRSLGWAGK